MVMFASEGSKDRSSLHSELSELFKAALGNEPNKYLPEDEHDVMVVHASDSQSTQEDVNLPSAIAQGQQQDQQQQQQQPIPPEEEGFVNEIDDLVSWLTKLEPQLFQPVLGAPEELPCKGRVICLDVETTGLTARDSVLDIGAVELIDGVRTGALFQCYLMPLHPVSSGAAAVHGLSEDFLRKIHALPPPVAMASFLNWIGNSPCVSHNAHFDSRMLNQELSEVGYHHKPEAPRIFVHCSMTAFKKRYPDSLGFSLDDAARHYGFSELYKRTSHGALLDAEMCAAVYQRLIQDGPSS